MPEPTVDWRGGDSEAYISGSYYVGFFGDTFGDSISVGDYQNSSFVTDSIGTTSYGPLPNVKFIGSTTADWGDGTESIEDIENNECTLRVTVSSGSGFNLQAIKLIAWDGGADDTVGPTKAVLRGFKKGDNTTTILSGSAQPLNLTPYSSSIPSTFYNYYIGLSATPTVVGTINTVALKIYGEYY